jgi:hypothetical protein
MRTACGCELISRYSRERTSLFSRIEATVFVSRLECVAATSPRTFAGASPDSPLSGPSVLSLTLAAYVGEEATIRFDPRDLGEIWLFYNDRFLCRAISLRVTSKFVYTRLAGARPDM